MSELNAADKRLLEENIKLKEELARFKQSSPVVGVRWYGEGGFGIGLTYLIGGRNRVILSKRGDKGVIDLAAWERIQNTDEVKYGIIVRDDSVIEEERVIGVPADEDKVHNPNAFTVEEIKKILNRSVTELKKVINKFTHYFPAKHFLKTAEEIGFKDENKLSLIRERYEYLFSKFKWSLLHIHDLNAACELSDIPFEGRKKEELIEELVRKELLYKGD